MFASVGSHTDTLLDDYSTWLLLPLGESVGCDVLLAVAATSKVALFSRTQLTSFAVAWSRFFAELELDQKCQDSDVLKREFL